MSIEELSHTGDIGRVFVAHVYLLFSFSFHLDRAPTLWQYSVSLDALKTALLTKLVILHGHTNLVIIMKYFSLLSNRNVIGPFV